MSQRKSADGQNRVTVLRTVTPRSPAGLSPAQRSLACDPVTPCRAEPHTGRTPSSASLSSYLQRHGCGTLFDLEARVQPATIRYRSYFRSRVVIARLQLVMVISWDHVVHLRSDQVVFQCHPCRGQWNGSPRSFPAYQSQADHP